jgi:hypothetical protein
MRTTKDIDCIVPSIRGKLDYIKFTDQLVEKGWLQIMGEPLCRYRSPSGFVVDVMTVSGEALGFTSQWYGEAVRGRCRQGSAGAP